MVFSTYNIYDYCYFKEKSRKQEEEIEGLQCERSGYVTSIESLKIDITDLEAQLDAERAGNVDEVGTVLLYFYTVLFVGEKRMNKKNIFCISPFLGQIEINHNTLL